MWLSQLSRKLIPQNNQRTLKLKQQQRYTSKSNRQTLKESFTKRKDKRNKNEIDAEKEQLSDGNGKRKMKIENVFVTAWLKDDFEYMVTYIHTHTCGNVSKTLLNKIVKFTYCTSPRLRVHTYE